MLIGIFGTSISRFPDRVQEAARVIFLGKRVQRRHELLTLNTTASPSKVGQLLNKLAILLGLCICVVGVYTAATTASIVYRSFSPVIDWDQWEMVNDVLQSNGHPSASQLWAQQNEHRIPFGRLACYADLKWFGGRNVSLLIESYLVQALALLLFAFLLRRLAKLSRPAYLTAIGFVAFCLFSPVQIDNFVRGFQVTFVLCIFAACFAFAAMAMYYASVSESRAKLFSGLLLASLFSATVAELSLSSGLLVWPILIILSFLLNLPRRTKLIIGMVGGLAACAYFWHFRFPHRETGLTDNLRHPFELALFIRDYFASAWASPTLKMVWPTMWDANSKSSWRVMTEAFTGVALAASIFGIARFALVKEKRNGLHAFLFANLLFVIATAAMTAVGRLNSGIAQAASTRYQTVSLIFWASLAILAIEYIDTRQNLLKMVQAQLAVLVLLVTSIGHFNVYQQIAIGRQATLRRAYEALIRDPSDMPSFRALSPAVWMVPRWYAYLKANGWGPRPESGEGSRSWAEESCASSLCQHSVMGYTLVSPSACAGVLDHVISSSQASNRLEAFGWAWIFSRAAPPRKVLLVLSTGEVIGEASTGLPRPDVPLNVRGITGNNTGWKLNIQAPKHGVLRAFAVLNDSKSVCPLDGEYHR